MNQQITIALHTLGLVHVITSEPDELYASSTEIARRIGTNPVVVRRVVAQMASAGLLETRRGAQGGSKLAMGPECITARMVYEAIRDEDATIVPRRCARGSGCDVGPAISEYLSGIYADAEEALLAKLDEVTLADIHHGVSALLAERGCAPHTP